MKSSDITTSLEPNIKLKKSGFPQDGLFYYVIINDKAILDLKDNFRSDFKKDFIYYSAPTTDELLEAIRKDNRYDPPATDENIINRAFSQFPKIKDLKKALVEYWLYLNEQGLFKSGK